MFDNHVCGHKVKRLTAERKMRDVTHDPFTNAAMCSECWKASINTDHVPAPGHERVFLRLAPRREYAMATAQLQPAYIRGYSTEQQLFIEDLRIL
ncbi:MAG TPA: hypothetical protein VFZ22_17770 [Pyrinomonadaceae bacterium]|nr:hypothetical protein [Pyrinomonadaceae bacterium]